MKIFEARAIGGVILADKGAVVNCPILGEGGNSEGYVVMAEDKVVYLPKTSPDLKTTLEYIGQALEKIASGIYQRNGGGDITNPTFAPEILAIKAQIDTLKGELK